MQLAFRDGLSRTGHASFLNSLELVLDGWFVPGLVPGTIVALFTSFSDSSRKRLPPGSFVLAQKIRLRKCIRFSEIAWPFFLEPLNYGSPVRVSDSNATAIEETFPSRRSFSFSSIRTVLHVE